MTGNVETEAGREATGHGRERALDGSYFQGARPQKAGPDPQAVLLDRFPPRLLPKRWAATSHARDEVVARLSGPPFLTGRASLDHQRRRGLRHVLAWLEAAEGDTWQERWARSGADAMGHRAWRAVPASWLVETGTALTDPAGVSLLLGRGMLLVVAGDVVRPSLGWLSSPGTPRGLVAELARSRDPGGFAALSAIGEDSAVNAHTLGLALRRVAAIVAAKGGTVADIGVGDCLELLRITEDVQVGGDATSPYFYQLLRSAGVFADGPPAGRALRTQGQLGCAALIDRYGIECRPVRDLLVDYLAERRPALDYASLHKLSYTLGRLFWRDLELHHPGISSLRLAADVATGWKQRIATKATRSVDQAGAASRASAPRVNAADHLMVVRAFYLDLIEWAVDDPARWGPWAHPSPVRAQEIAPRRKAHAQRKSRMDQRTRERMPVLPALIAHVQTAATATAERLTTAKACDPGGTFTSGGETLRRAVTRHASVGKIWAEDPATAKRRDLGLEEHRAFWVWAAVEVLRHTGIRIEELSELSHHSFVEYTLPGTGEVIPLLHIVPSKTDTERLLVISPELADVLSVVIRRVSDNDGAVPLVVAYDYHERVWNPPSPLLFQRHHAGEHRPIGGPPVRELLAAALARSGLTDASGRSLRFTPHDFRRIFVTDAILHGMPPHIAQLVVGHRDITTTMGYKAVYPEEAITSHRAFLARRRDLRPSEEYRTPTDEEWDDFLGHFERRKLALGTCGRSYATPCIHEHACVRCPLLRPDPTARPRLVEIGDNLVARIDEARRQGWLGEVGGLEITLAATKRKLGEMDQLALHHRTVVKLGPPRSSHTSITGTGEPGPEPS
ncbi:MAG: site-specific integrase [Actinomycetota bacterium]|nr:site-specific integrase [Actinomycetota bacterium]